MSPLSLKTSWIKWTAIALPLLVAQTFGLAAEDGFRPSATDERGKAQATCENLGLAVDGESLIRVVQAGHWPLAEALLHAGVDVNETGAGGESALFVAVRRNDCQMMENLLQAGADPNAALRGGCTPLMAAAVSSDPGALRLLLEHGARLDLLDHEGHGALHYAVAARRPETLEALLRAGASVSEGAGAEGRPDALAAAYASGDWRLIEPLLAREPARAPWGAASRQALEQAVAGREASRVRLLLAKHAGQPLSATTGQPILANALLSGDFEQFKFLLSCGLDPNTTLVSPVEKSVLESAPPGFLREALESDAGINVLMLAAGLGRADFARELLARGAKRGTETARGKSPAVLFAAHAKSAPVMQMLIPDSPAPGKVKIEISLGEQRASVLKEGIPVFTTEISTGKPGYETPAGDFVVTDKIPMHKSTIYKVNMPFFLRLNAEDFGMHEGELPGGPASHGCIRLPGPAARRLFQEIPIGTLVSIKA